MSVVADVVVAVLLVVGGVFGAVASWSLVRLPDPMTRLHGPTKAATLGVGAVLIGFSHGSNDVANIAAPLGVLLRSAGLLAGAEPFAAWLLALGGTGIALGALLFGRRAVHMVGSRISRLNTPRALCVALATALTVLAATRLGLPVSTTHVAVGGVFGVGFYREWEERRFRRPRPRQPLPPEELHRRRLVRRAALVRTLAAWVVTMPAVGALAATLALALG